MMPPIIHLMAKNWCAAQNVKSYAWFFDRQLPGDENGAWHSSDLWYWFGTLENCWRPMTKKDNAVSEQMTDYLANFCKFGDPNGAGLTAWLPAGKKQGKVLCIGEKDTHMGKPDMLKLAKTMVTNKSVGE
jgi:para-nitrobenzyl esterase